VIPGGAHTYSKGADQFPSNAPQILKSGKGVHVYDEKDSSFLDFGMGLRSVLIGYSEEEVDNQAIKYLKRGMNLTRPSTIELEAAELMVDLVRSAEMVKFTKNGSTAVTAAVKLARAYTGRKLVAVCSDHPFFSYDDWFIGSTPMSKGIPDENKTLTKTFKYNNLSSLQELVSKYPQEIACVVLEPQASECPNVPGYATECCAQANCSRLSKSQNSFLQQVQELCKANGIVFILDEMITGFRWGLGGAQERFNLDPDLSTFGKAIANGYPLACVVGRREIMSLGSIETTGQERLFLVSTTHGGDMASLGAFAANVEIMRREPVVSSIWNFGFKLISLMNNIARKHNIEQNFRALGPACSPRFETRDADSNISLEFRTLFIQEMLRSGILMPWISLAYRHVDSYLKEIEEALESTFSVYAKALESRPSDFLEGESIKPVFRKFN
jgi:glutamate-1-semialdehyde 2,1-aminomutase